MPSMLILHHSHMQSSYGPLAHDIISMRSAVLNKFLGPGLLPPGKSTGRFREENQQAKALLRTTVPANISLQYNGQNCTQTLAKSDISNSGGYPGEVVSKLCLIAEDLDPFQPRMVDLSGISRRTRMLPLLKSVT